MSKKKCIFADAKNWCLQSMRLFVRIADAFVLNIECFLTYEDKRDYNKEL